MKPGNCQTDCLERPVSQAFRALGAFVGAHPWPFLLAPLVLSGALATGFLLLPSHEDNDLERQFTPSRGPAKRERRFVQQHFLTNDGQRFTAERLTTEGSFVSLIAVAARDSDSLLTRAAFAQLLELDQAVRGIQAPGFSFDGLCARNNGSCYSPNQLLSAVQGDPAGIEALLPRLTFPLFQGRLFLGFSVGGVTLGVGVHPARPLLAARALRLIYFMQEDEPGQRLASSRWLQVFLERIPGILASLNLTDLKVTYFTSLSRQAEFDKISEKVIPLISVAYVLTIAFSILSCARLDCVRTKVWVASFGVLAAGLSIVSSFGLLLLFEVPFVITAANSPFLVLGVGIDDMFILVSCWQQTKVEDSVKDRMADTYAEAAVSVTITTLTDVCVFFVGTSSSLGSIQSFCRYAGTAFVFCYIYNLTFLGAVLALNGRREESNRHWLTFMKVKDQTDSSRGRMYNICCVGGSFDKSTGAETEHPMKIFFRKWYGPFLMHTLMKIYVVLLYVTYLGSSIYGCTQIKEGIDRRNVAIDNSYVIPYYDWEDTYFSTYGPRVMVIVTESIGYWNKSERDTLENCLALLTSTSFVDKTLSESWLAIYQTVAIRMPLNLDDHNTFIANLALLFSVNPESQWDVNIKSQDIVTSRFFIQTVNVKNAVDEKHLLNKLRHIAKNCKIPLMVYHPAFIYFDQFAVIVHNTIQNIVIASGAMLLISLMLIPHPLCSLWVTFAIVSVIVGVAGLMPYWNINLDSISMIHLIICIGFSVDSAAHISYAFVLSEKSKVNDKAIDALHLVGYPILQGSLSTIVGILMLVMAPSYVFRTFLKIMFLVILWGAAHGLIFIPVFLTFFGSCDR